MSTTDTELAPVSQGDLPDNVEESPFDASLFEPEILEPLDDSPYQPPENDKQAAEFTENFLEHRQATWGIILGITKNPDTADEVTQHVFLKLWSKWNSYTELGLGRGPWIKRTARNEAINWYRKARREPHDLYDFQEESRRVDAIRSTPSAEDTFMNSDLGNDLVEALKALPLEFRAAVMYVDVQDLSYKETAELSGVPIGTIMSRVHRGRNKLRGILSSEINLE